MYIVDRMTQFKPTEQKTMSGETVPGQSGELIALMQIPCVDLSGKVHRINV